ncbi:androgen-induced gene 1 protein-like [Aricia agestis]|uniref:androgen-induced gene 1 protein-like n=1 Tax=Aricia agestis TaxID=91739 RepID=UPI001C2052D8|nr:androgen-induced gene 1 protein-like [Aricia agestis]
MYRPLFHLSVAALNSYVLWYDQKYVELPFPTKEMGELPLKARSVFLTMWCLLLQTVYYYVSFLCDFLADSSRKRHMLHKIRDAMFAVAFPLAIFVAATFWSIYLVDRELIFPETLDNIFPPFFNQVMHTTVAIFIVIDLFITYREYPTRSVGFGLFMSIFLVYLVWTFYIFATCKAWVYPVFDHFTWPQRILFIVFSFVTGASFYIAGEKVNSMVCPKRTKQKNVATNGKSKHS